MKRKNSANSFEVLLWALFAAAIMLKCSNFQFATKLNLKPYFTPFNNNMYFATLASVLLILSFIILVFNKKRLTALICFDILITILVFADTVYFRYFYNALTIPVLYNIGLVGSVKESIKTLIKPDDLIYLADFPVLIAGIIILKRNIFRQIDKLHIVKRLVTGVIILTVSLGLFQWTYGKSQSGIFSYDNNYVINNLGILYFHYYDIKRFLTEHFFTDHTLSEEEKKHIASFYDQKKADGKKYNGAAKGKNLIVIQMEAIQQFIINRKINGSEITPNLNKLMNEGAYFDNFYYQIGGGNTSDAEFLTNTSLYPLKEGAVYFRYPTNTYESTANILKEQGYGTYVFHANSPSFWNRTEMYRSLGFDKFYSANDFKQDEHIGWGLGDKSFFRQSLDKINTSRPFYGFFITLSSHHPFNYFNGYTGINTGKYDKTFLGDYIKAANYVDQAIGSLFDDLKKRGLYDKTVIVLYGDHYAIPRDKSALFKEFFNYTDSEFDWTRQQKTPCFIRFPGLDQPGLKKITGGEIDILPTIANLMGFDAPHAMGKDLFNTDKGYAVLRNSTVITDDFTYLNIGERVYDNSGKILNLDDHTSQIRSYQDQLAVSDIILGKDALKQLK